MAKLAVLALAAAMGLDAATAQSFALNGNKVTVPRAEMDSLLLGGGADGRGVRSEKVTMRLPFSDGSMREFVLRADTDTLSAELSAKYDVASYLGVELTAHSDVVPLQAVVTHSKALGTHIEYFSPELGTVYLDMASKAPLGDADTEEELVFRNGRGTVAEKRAPLSCGVDEFEPEDVVEAAAGGLRRALQVTDPPNLNNCGARSSVGNRRCDPAANVAECAYDGGDCCSIYATCGSSDPSQCACIDPKANVAAHRQYRFAIGATRGYAAFYNNNEAAIVSSYVPIVARVNRFYKRELSVSLRIIDEVGELALDTGMSDSSSSASQFQGVADRRVGFNAYDIGHAFGNYLNGVSQGLGIVCGSGKARGSTGVLAFTYPEWVVAHELAHMLGAPHTFSACRNSNAVGVETGSGTSMMSYGGTCGADSDVDGDRDTLFHSWSIDKMLQCIDNPSRCGACGSIVADRVQDASGRPAPVAKPARVTDLDADDCDASSSSSSSSSSRGTAVSAQQFTCSVPKSTPFKLEGRRTAESPNLFYAWEQSDVSSSRDENRIIRPQNTRTILSSSVFPVRDSLSRTWPSMDKVRRGMDVLDTRERMPDRARSMTFTLTVRTSYLPERSLNIYDQREVPQPVPEDGLPVPELGSMFMSDKVTVNVEDLTPLRLTAVPSAIAPGASATVRWTTGTAGLSPSVRISLSLDDGLSFPYVLAASVANNGAATVQLPPRLANCQLGLGRIKVESLLPTEGCSFFAINDGSIAVDGCAAGTPPPVPVWPKTPSPSIPPTSSTTPSPTAGEVEVTPSPTAGEVEVTPSPTVGEVEATPSPTVGEVEATPSPTVTGGEYDFEVGPDSGRVDQAGRTGSGASADGTGYGNDVRRSFLVTAPAGRRATVRFSTLRLQWFSDYVSFFDGESGRSLGQATGTFSWRSFTAESSSLVMVFTTDASGTSGGFVADYGSSALSATGSRPALPKAALATVGINTSSHAVVPSTLFAEGNAMAERSYQSAGGNRVQISLVTGLVGDGSVQIFDGTPTASGEYELLHAYLASDMALPLPIMSQSDKLIVQMVNMPEDALVEAIVEEVDVPACRGVDQQQQPDEEEEGDDVGVTVPDLGEEEDLDVEASSNVGLIAGGAAAVGLVAVAAAFVVVKRRQAAAKGGDASMKLAQVDDDGPTVVAVNPRFAE